MNYGMRCHDICPKADMDAVSDTVRDLGIHQIQLAFGKSIVGLDLSYGHYFPGLGRMVAGKLQEREIHVAMLDCYISPANLNEAKWQTEVQKFIEHLKYAKTIGTDMVGTETRRCGANFRVALEARTGECYRLLLKNMRGIVATVEEPGMIMGVRGVYDYILYNPQIMRRLLEDVDSSNVEVILDPVNLIGEDEIESQAQVIDEASRLYGDRITMVHVKNFTRDSEGFHFVHVGDGLFDHAPPLKHLKEQKPYVTMLLENSAAERYYKDARYLRKMYENA